MRKHVLQFNGNNGKIKITDRIDFMSIFVYVISVHKNVCLWMNLSRDQKS